MANEEQAGYWIQIDPDSKPGEPRGYLRIRGLVQDAVYQPGLQYVKRYEMLQTAVDIAEHFSKDSQKHLQQIIEGAKRDVDRRYASQFQRQPGSPVSPVSP